MIQYDFWGNEVEIKDDLPPMRKTLKIGKRSGIPARGRMGSRPDSNRNLILGLKSAVGWKNILHG